MSEPQVPFPPVIDSSMRGQFVACPQQFKLRYLDLWAKKGPSIHLHFGGAFATGMEIFRLNFYGGSKSKEESFFLAMRAIILHWGEQPIEGEHDTKTLANCILALDSYFTRWEPSTDFVRPHNTERGPAVEFSFALPLPINHPQTGEPLIYAGRFDMLAEMNKSLWIEDDKTTTQLGPSWANQFRLRAQFTGYVWGAQEFGYPVQGAIVRGISILKTGFGHAEVVEQRPKWMIERWHHQLLRDVNRMIASWKEGEWDLALDAACASYGGCSFLDICTNKDPQSWLEADYEKRPYDPLHFEDVAA